MDGEDEKLTSKSKVDLTRLPPCHLVLKPHVQRMNHRVALYKRADQAILQIPKLCDDGQGWRRTTEGVLELVWSCGPALPTPLVDILHTVHREEEEEEEFDFDSFIEHVDSDDE